MGERYEIFSEQLKRTVSNAMYHARKAYEIIFSEYPNESAIVGYLNYASSFVSTAKAIYITNLSLLERNDIDDFFVQFDEFVTTTLDNLAENHSHQYSDIEFNKLEEKYRNSIFLC